MRAPSAAGEQVATGLLDVERASLDEHVRGDGDPGRVGEHVRDEPVDVRVCVGVLGRHRVRAEPGGHAAAARTASSCASSVSWSSP